MTTDERSLQVAIRTRPRSADRFTLDVQFEIPPGITVLFGPSGSGKSSTLSAIAGLLRPEAGRIALGDEVWFDAVRGHHEPVERRGVALVFQSLALFPHMNGWRNVAYGMDRALSRAQRRARAHALLERVKVPELAERRPATYSGGEAQRVALARAMGRSPKVMLLDEPFSALHRALRSELRADVRAMLHELRIPAILVTHQRSDARAMGDRMVLLDSGRVRAQGRVDTLLADLDATVEPDDPTA